MSESNTANQAKEIAETTNTSVENVHKLAAFLDSLFGNVISNSFGLLGDKLAYYRFEGAIKYHEAVDEKLRKRGVDKRYVPVSFGLPIIEKAIVEESPILQDKWANLLANARDATYDKPLRRNFSTMLADLEPVDAKILDILVREYLEMPSDRDSLLFIKDNLVKGYKLPAHVVENSVRNLMRLGLIKPGVVTGSVSMGGHRVSSYKDTEMFQVTGLGVDFFHAVNDAPPKS